MRMIFIAVAALGLTHPLVPAAVWGQSASGPSGPPICLAPGGDGEAHLLARVGPPDSSALEIFAGAGAAGIVVHDLSEEEELVVERSLARLPALHRDVLQRHLRRLSFLDLQDGAGSALTSRVGLEETSPRFDITFRASLLRESLTDFMDAKEARLFADDGTGFSVAFDAGPTDALTYVLLHEATHVVDQVLGLTDDPTGPFRRGIWEDLRTPADPHASSIGMETPFRRRPPVPLAAAADHYEALRHSPFVTFYATAAATEDLAELFAWQQLTSRFDQTLTLTVRDRDGLPVYRYAPLSSDLVQPRFAEVEAVLRRYEQECVSPPD